MKEGKSQVLGDRKQETGDRRWVKANEDPDE